MPVFHECKYALFSLVRSNPSASIDFKVTVYTDQPDFFEEVAAVTNLKINTRLISSSELDVWRGPDWFVHRVKICILQDFVAHHAGSVLYCDTDVVFLKPLQPLFEKIGAGTPLMHTQEGLIQRSKNRVLKKLHSFLLSNAAEAKDWIPDYYENGIDMWNAGVLGFQAKDATLLNSALHITDKLYKIYNRHIAEQFAFSYVLRGQGSILSADTFIRHYWNFKEFRPVLELFFDKYPTRKAFELMDLIDPIYFEAPKRRYESLPGWRRALRKISGTRWRMPEIHLP